VSKIIEDITNQIKITVPDEFKRLFLISQKIILENSDEITIHERKFHISREKNYGRSRITTLSVVTMEWRLKARAMIWRARYDHCCIKPDHTCSYQLEAL